MSVATMEWEYAQYGLNEFDDVWNMQICVEVCNNVWEEFNTTNIAWDEFVDKVNRKFCPYFKYVAMSRYIMMADGWDLQRGPATEIELVAYRKLQMANLKYAHLSSVEGVSMLACFDDLYKKYCAVFKSMILPKLASIAHTEKKLFYEASNIEIGYTEYVSEQFD